jgi:hypothetical protein
MKWLKRLFEYKIPDYVPRSLTRARGGIARIRDAGWWTPDFDVERVSLEVLDEAMEKKFVVIKQRGWRYTVHVASDIHTDDLKDGDVLVRFI